MRHWLQGGKFQWLQGTTLHSVSMIKNKSKSCLQDGGETTVYIVGSLEPSGGHRAVSKESRATTPSCWPEGNASQRRPSGIRRDLPQDVCDSDVRSYDAGTSPWWPTGGTDRLPPGVSQRASTRTGELFQYGELCPQQTLKWKSKITTNRNRVK